MQREKFSSRLGFLLISAGCAIGLGNVWRFPYIVGKYGGAAFVILYLAFLIIMGLPIMVMELSVGRASQKSIAKSFDTLEKKGSKFHWYKYPAIAGNYLLMMFYTSVAGWMLIYCKKLIKIQPRKWNAYKQLIRSYIAEGQYDLASLYLKKAEQLFADKNNLYVLKAELHLKQRDFLSAEKAARARNAIKNVTKNFFIIINHLSNRQ